MSLIETCAVSYIFINLIFLIVKLFELSEIKRSNTFVYVKSLEYESQIKNLKGANVIAEDHIKMLIEELSEYDDHCITLAE